MNDETSETPAAQLKPEGWFALRRGDDQGPWQSLEQCWVDVFKNGWYTENWRGGRRLHRVEIVTRQDG